MTDIDSSAPPAEPSSRLFLRPIGPDTTKEQIEDLFSAQGPIKEVKLIKNYGFIEFDSLDDAVRAKDNVDGEPLNGEPLFCTYANPIKVREPRQYRDRNDRGDRGDRDRKVEDIYRVNISGLAPGVSWQDLKDFGRTADVEVTYTNVSRDREGEGVVEFRSADHMEQAVSKLDGTEFMGEIVTMKIDPNPRPRERRPDRRGDRGDRGGRDGRDRDGRDRRRDTYMPSRNGDRGDRRGGDRRGGRDGRDGGRGGDRGDRGGDRGPRRDRRGSRGDRDRDDRRGGRDRDDRDDRRRDDRDDRRRDDRDELPERRRSLSPDARRGSPPPPPPPPADPVW